MARIICLLAVLFCAATVNAAPVASRSSGVAPLAVHFWANVAASDGSGVEPFHDYEYSWDFGETGSGTWGPSGRSKDSDKGPVAAHVFETPGTYTVTMTVRDSTGIIGTPDEIEITVSDPDTVYSGTKTTCISTTSDFTGCPTGAAQVTTSSLAGIGSYTGVEHRVLLRRGSSWSVTSTPTMAGNAGPVHIGAFGTCTSPDSLGICSNAPAVALTGASTGFLNLNYKTDWRLSDIAFTGQNDTTAPFGGGTALINNLALRIKVVGGSGGLTFTSWRENDSEYIDGTFVVSSSITDTYDMNAWIGAERLVMLGNVLQNSGISHVLRVWQAYQAVISHNLITGTGAGLHAIKLHGPTPLNAGNGQNYVGTFAAVLAAHPGTQMAEGGLRQLSQFMVVANNVFGNAGPWVVSIGPQNGVYDERVIDMIFEKNRIIGDFQSPPNIAIDSAVVVAAQYVTARNNWIDGTEGDLWFLGFHAERRGIEPVPTGIRIYNNTIYSRATHADGAHGIRIESVCTNVIVMNNYVSLPNAVASKEAVVDNSGSATVGDNVLTDTPYFVDPNNATPLSRDFSLASSATLAIDQGYTVPVLDDFAGDYRTAPYDIGAFEFGDEVPATSATLSGGVCTGEIR